MIFFVSSDYITKWSRTEEILLFKSKFFSTLTWVIWIQNTCNILCALSLADSTKIITSVELIKVKFVIWSWSPQAQVIRVVSVISRNWSVICLSNNLLTSEPFSSLYTVFNIFPNISTESNRVHNIGSFDFPWVSMFKPVVWNFNLFAILNHLFKYSIIISDTISPSRNFKSC